LLEAALVVVAGVGFAFAANELSPSGLKLKYDYFPGAAGRPKAATVNSASTPGVPSPAHADSADAQVAGRLKEKGLQPISRAETERLWHDPRYQQGFVIFVDARDEDHYAEGHIPGAFQLNPYHPEKELGAVLTPCQNADQVVVYCAGGDCEDADSTAILLTNAGISNQKLFVYGGGFTDWTDHRLPVETGARNSGAAPAGNK
jgi:rhodanese-related sulfurtransferase